ncbi:hypothetical protein EBT16_00990 [bacterium]|nr:hypothetical protein [bacterium]
MTVDELAKQAADWINRTQGDVLPCPVFRGASMVHRNQRFRILLRELLRHRRRTNRTRSHDGLDTAQGKIFVGRHHKGTRCIPVSLKILVAAEKMADVCLNESTDAEKRQAAREYREAVEKLINA